MALRSKNLISVVLLIIVVGVLYFLPSLFFEGKNNERKVQTSTEDDLVRSKVLKIKVDEKYEDPMSNGQSYAYVQMMDIKILSGDHKGKIITAENTTSDMMLYKLIVKEGDEILVLLELDDSGQAKKAFVHDVVRDKYLAALAIVFAIFILIFGGMKGFKSLVTLILTGVIVIRVMFPMILRGYSPIAVTIAACAIITVAALLIINGYNKKTLNAVIGTIGGVLVSGITAYIVVTMSRVTGLDEHEAQMLMSLPITEDFDYRGILFSGIIMGALGAVMDIGMSIASSMNEIELAKPDISSKDLIKSGLNIGKDIMGTMTDTLILAYAGSSIHLILLFLAYDVNMVSIFNMDMVATEVIRALAGSIGLVFTIPITALVAGTIGRRKKQA
jgi:uncharacterized membrane protein